MAAGSITGHTVNKEINMNNKTILSCLALLMLFAGSAYAIGPSELMIYGGPTGNNYNGGYNVGASVMLDVPMMPKIGAEVERSVLANNVNITRVGFVYEITLVPFVSGIRLSTGASSLSSNSSFSIGSYTFSSTNTTNGSYASAGIILKVLNLAFNPKYIYTQYGNVNITEVVINVGMTF